MSRGLLSMFRRAGQRRSLISEPINIVTGALGAGKTLFAIEQADLLREAGDAALVYQININEPDVRKLPPLPFPLEEWHKRADAGELRNAVIIVDEFHKLCPPRAINSRPPEFIEEMGEARRRGVRFLFLTQSSEFDHYLKGTRLNRHFYVQRKAGIGRATILEWVGRFVSNPNENPLARKEAIVHLWKHPVKKYGDWYKSAESHHFRARIPLRLWVVPVFVAALGWFGFNAYGKVGDLLNGETIGAVSKPVEEAGDGKVFQRDPKRVEIVTEPGRYLERFTPVVPHIPMSAPAFQGREPVAEPQLLCVMSGPDGADGCNCYTEQATPYRPALDDAMCREIARHGVYDPFRSPVGGARAAQTDGKADYRPRPSGRAGGGEVSQSEVTL